MRIHLKILLLLSATSLLSCQRSDNGSNVWEKPESTTISCDEYFNFETKMGILNNNVWNKHAAEKDEWTQCVEKRIVGTEVQFGWSWSWPFGRKVIYAYPQIKVGSSPWAPEPKFDSSFPLKISEIKNLTISHDIEVHTNGQHNTATTMWLIDEPYAGTQANTSVIKAEVMIWTYSTDRHFNPAGRKHDEIIVNDIVWEVWHQKNWKDQSGVNKNKWTSLSFRSQSPSMQATIPALKLLNYAVKEGLIPENLYVADVELGNEVMSGAGITWVKDFDIVHD